MKTSKKNPLILILLGKSGSGKGTQAKLLADKFHFNYIGSGDLLRERAEKKDFNGEKITQSLVRGELVASSVIFKIWFDKIEELRNLSAQAGKKNLKGIVLDGNPRKINEAYLMEDAFEWFEWEKSVKVLLIDISNKEAVWRLTKRRICQKCKEIIPFIGEFRKITKCPKCGGGLVERNDDTLIAVKKRLKWFKTDVQPIINYYKKAGSLIRINGEQPIEDVFKDILKVLK